MRSPEEVNIEGTSLSARLSGHVQALLRDSGCHTRRIVPDHADLSEVDLRGKILDSADLSFVSLRGGCLAQADLRHADLTGSDLSGADLSGADLSGARMSQADLRNADMRGIRFASGGAASFADARLDGVNLDGAKDAEYYLKCGAPRGPSATTPRTARVTRRGGA